MAAFLNVLGAVGAALAFAVAFVGAAYLVEAWIKWTERMGKR